MATSLALVGCGADASAERQVHQLSDEIRRVQAERDQLDQRLAAFSEASAEASAAPAASRTDAAQVETPALRVIRLGPEGEPTTTSAVAPPEGMATDDPAPRPAVRAEAAPRGPARRSGSEVIVSGDGEPPPTLDPRAKRAYDDALALVHGRRYAEALDAFATFLVRWPDHPYAANAFYWRGECFFAQASYARAAEQFEATLNRFPYGAKAPDALLKLGMTQDRLGQRNAADATFDRLKREHPGSEAVRRIPRGRP